jgi:hypothetical protein
VKRSLHGRPPWKVEATCCFSHCFHLHVQVIAIFQQAASLGQGFLSLLHIIVNAPSSLVNLCQMTSIFCRKSFIITLHCHFITMNPLCIRSLREFCYLFVFIFLWVVSTCVLICLVLLMDGFPSSIFTYRVFLFFICKLMMKPSQNFIKGKAPTQKGKGKGTKRRRRGSINVQPRDNTQKHK